MIDKNENVPAVQKLQYLLAAVQGSALDVIKHLPVSNHNYDTAWNLLFERYENIRMIYFHVLAQFNAFESIKEESVQNLQKLISITYETIETLKNIKINIEEDSKLTYDLISKLPVRTRTRLEENSETKKNSNSSGSNRSY